MLFGEINSLFDRKKKSQGDITVQKRQLSSCPLDFSGIFRYNVVAIPVPENRFIYKTI